MPRSDWLPYLAIVGIVLLLGEADAQPAPPNNAHAEQTQEAQQKKSKKSETLKPSIPAPVQPRVNSAPNPLKTVNAAQSGSAEEQRAQANIETQQDMARSARNMFWIGVAENCLTFLGILLVAWTLHAARRSAAAAEKTLAAMIRHERPYLLAEHFRHSGLPTPQKAKSMAQGDISPCIFGTAKNYGDRLAILHGFSTGQAWAKELPLPRVEPDNDVWFMHQAIAPGETHIWNPWMYLTLLRAGTVRWIVSEEKNWFLFGYFRYSDTHGIIRRSGFAFSYRYLPEDGPYDSFFRPCGPSEYWYDEEERQPPMPAVQSGIPERINWPG